MQTPARTSRAHASQPADRTSPPTAELGNQEMQSLLRSGAIQAKLTISPPDDPLEREADRVADAVMSGKRPCACGGTCEKCRGSSSSHIHRKPEGKTASHSSGTSLRTAPSSLIRSIGPGQPLDATTRQFFETRMGHDFSGTRIYTNDAASSAAASINARAFTHGNDVVFGRSHYQPTNPTGQRLLAHELTHVVQQSTSDLPESNRIMREPDAPNSTAQSSIMTESEAASARPREGAQSVVFKGVELSDDRDYMYVELWNLIGRLGLVGAELRMQVLNGAPTYILPSIGYSPVYGGPRPRSPLDAMRDARREEEQNRLLPRLIPIANDVWLQVRGDAEQFLKDFESQAIANLRRTLEAHKAQAKAEGIRYGITEQQIERTEVEFSGEGQRSYHKVTETRYGMSADSPAAKSLQAAASVLLDRQREIERLQELQGRQMRYVQPLPFDRERIGAWVPTPESQETAGRIQEKEQTYDRLRDELSAEYPALAAFSERKAGIAGLQGLAAGPGAVMAALIGEKIAEKLANIKKVQEELDKGDLNIWRIPKIIDITKVHLGADTNPPKRRLVEDKLEDEEPGFWESIALFALNIGALLLAGPTGGLSLAVAAGVNLAVAAVHIDEYMLQSALTGTTFDKAQAISQDEPSLFWLAIEIIGAVADVGGAVRTISQLNRARSMFQRMTPAVRSARSAATDVDFESAIQDVRVTAGAGNEEVAAKIISTLRRERASGGGGRIFASATPDEAKRLRAATQVSESALGVEAAQTLSGGMVKASPSGWLWVCESPCKLLRDRYAAVLARDPGLLKELEETESLFKNAIESSLESYERLHSLERELRRMDALQTARSIHGLTEEEAVRLGEYLQRFSFDQREVVLDLLRTSGAEPAAVLRQMDVADTLGQFETRFGSGSESLWGTLDEASIYDTRSGRTQKLRGLLQTAKGEQAHHIIPMELWQHPLIDHFQRVRGWDGDSVANGISLPTGPVKLSEYAGPLVFHKGSHPVYTSIIESRLEQIYQPWRLGHISDDEAYQKLLALTDEFYSKLERGVIRNPKGRLP